MRVLLDTNLWVSAMLGRAMRERIGQLVKSPRIQLLASQELLDELREVARRPKFHRYFEAGVADGFLDSLAPQLEFISPVSQIQRCRDPKDDYLLAICRDGKADFLLTGDNDLLVLNPFEATEILTLTAFESQLLLS